MFNLGMVEILLLFVIGLLVLGPKQLPQVARVLGRFAGEVKKAVNDFNQEIDKNTKNFKKESDDIQKGIDDAYKSLDSPSKKEEDGKS